ncbi:hypothetical protein ABMA27_002728 [Loxostege sticticalis]|uniref:Integrase zinc-binding domain-containing protein n=1 Tax=Loxostege sticticalis TaxID=481309 RepID=A0ABR3HUP8_LOXSC
MWFQGPDFLQSKTILYQKPKEISTDLETVKVKSHCATASEEHSIWDRFSSLTRMIRVIAYCKRFIHNTRKETSNKLIGILNTQELKEAMICCIRKCQRDHFEHDITIINNNENLPKRSSLRALNPFLDENHILRVGGRLENTQWSGNRKHPILLPKKSHLTDLIIDNAHKQTLHGGPQLMLCYLQSTYWILSAKQRVKAHFKKCVTCFKNANKGQTQLMGQLPAARVTPTRPFKSSGVDYAGPIQIRTAKGRGHKSHKAYICLFVCMVTRAIHLEVVTELTPEGFLQAFKRFVARRGYCTDIWSDNATNFVGASSELKRLFASEKGSMAQEVAEVLATNGCTWHFIPSRSPNFGGLWEAGLGFVMVGDILLKNKP